MHHMNDGLDDIFGDSGTGSTGDDKPKGGGLRAQLEQLLAQNKVLQEQVEQSQAQNRARGLNELFTKHQIPELARDFFPKEGDLTDEAATKFVEKYGQLWGAKAAEAVTPAPEQSATTAMQTLAAQAGNTTIEPLSEEHYRSKFAEATTKAELMAMFGGLAVGAPGL